eukprot:TRINITY_DN6306_c0_g1_i3.p1 TRINITY_DN6306_c0_g1~~TRINITY_DN6306_c0_g1_i3.p1  ORF type:complete len:184 (-),score=42.41 TRINITY_DN6306_c0_g1_i3:538-1089(-)
MLGPPVDVLVETGGKWVPFIKQRGESWRLLTSIFLHAGIVHLLLNLVTQILIGIRLERIHGTFRIAGVYLVSGVYGFLFSSIFLPNTVSVGASGSIFGFFGVLLNDLLRTWKLLYHPFKSLGIYSAILVVSLGLGLLPLVDNFAHVGGYLMGIIVGFIFIPVSSATGVMGKKQTCKYSRVVQA